MNMSRKFLDNPPINSESSLVKLVDPYLDELKRAMREDKQLSRFVPYFKVGLLTYDLDPELYKSFFPIRFKRKEIFRFYPFINPKRFYVAQVQQEIPESGKITEPLSSFFRKRDYQRIYSLRDGLEDFDYPHLCPRGRFPHTS